jgi:hypothetical protein
VINCFHPVLPLLALYIVVQITHIKVEHIGYVSLIVESNTGSEHDTAGGITGATGTESLLVLPQQSSSFLIGLHTDTFRTSCGHTGILLLDLCLVLGRVGLCVRLLYCLDGT